MPERFIGEFSITRQHFRHMETSVGIGDVIPITSFADRIRRKKGEQISMEDLSGGLLRIAEAADLLGVTRYYQEME